VASLLAIAALGAVVAVSFQNRLDSDLSHTQLSAQAHGAVARARSRPLVVAVTGVAGRERATIRAALVDASVHSFRLGMGIGAGLAVLGGVVALVGIANPRKRVPCADCPGGAIISASSEAAREPLPATVGSHA
jgi:hypothetical protein